MPKRSIYLGPADGKNHKPLYVEGIVDEQSNVVIEPGSLVKQEPETNNIRKDFDTASVSNNPILFADKDTARSKTVNDAWLVGESMVAILPRSGDFINAIVSQFVNRGEPLTRSGFGVLIAAETDGSEQILAYADEDKLIQQSDGLLRIRVA